MRVHGGAKRVAPDEAGTSDGPLRLVGTPFDQAIALHLAAKQAIGRAAAALCEPGEGIMMDGGTTTFQMCPHLAGLDLQVLTNSLYIVSALLGQPGTRLLVPSGTVFREQNIILAPAGEDSMPRFHAPKLFMGAASTEAEKDYVTTIQIFANPIEPINRFFTRLKQILRTAGIIEQQEILIARFDCWLV